MDVELNDSNVKDIVSKAGKKEILTLTCRQFFNLGICVMIPQKQEKHQQVSTWRIRKKTHSLSPSSFPCYSRQPHPWNYSRPPPPPPAPPPVAPCSGSLCNSSSTLLYSPLCHCQNSDQKAGWKLQAFPQRCDSPAITSATATFLSNPIPPDFSSCVPELQNAPNLLLQILVLRLTT